MHLAICLTTLVSLALVHGQQGEKGTSIIPYPRVGRSGGFDRYFMGDKRNNGASAGLIPFPRIGRSDPGFAKRQLIPFPRVGKRPYWHFSESSYPYFGDYDEYGFPGAGLAEQSSPVDTSPSPMDDLEAEKRSGTTPSGMWFGPRLGRKKRSIDSSPTSSEGGHRSSSSERHPSVETLDTRTLVILLRNFNWAIVPIKERRNSFTPRLGRSSSEEIGVHTRSQPPYSPRLGRSKEIVSDEIDLEEEVNDSTRHSRGSSGSGHHGGKATQPPPSDDSVSGGMSSFAPRLGRDFSPRLGRSGEDHE